MVHTLIKTSATEEGFNCFSRFLKEMYKDIFDVSIYNNRVWATMKKEWIVAGGICLIIGLLLILSGIINNTDFFQYLTGSGGLITGESVLALFIGIAFPSESTERN
jgi:hypothetical protein